MKSSDLNHHGVYHSGEVVGLGNLVCEKCRYHLAVYAGCVAASVRSVATISSSAGRLSRKVHYRERTVAASAMLNVQLGFRFADLVDVPRPVNIAF